LDPHYTYRLPTEAEREYAARAGTETAYSFGDNVTELPDYAWGEENSDGQTHPVARLKPNPAGLYDMHGNVWEWVQDGYDANPPGGVDPVVQSGSFRVLRGGSWHDPPTELRSARRSSGWAADPSNFHNGLRLVRTPKP
jgi:formylglycine-generating enzyme required for sulfatase activity